MTKGDLILLHLSFSLKDNFTDEMATEFFKEALAWQQEKGYKVIVIFMMLMVMIMIVSLMIIMMIIILFCVNVFLPKS